jgi:hypothetical protein
MATERIILKFRGDLAEQHMLPGYAGSQSLAGLARSILIPAAYLAKGEVRHRDIENAGVDLNLIALRPGSFETVFDLITDPTSMFVLEALGRDIAKDLAKDFIKDFVYGIMKRCIGEKASDKVENLETAGKLSTGDMGALVDATTPAMKLAHTAIGNGARNVVIINGSHNVITLNEGSKTYLLSSEEDRDPSEKECSIASFNANTGNGRAFDYTLGRTVAFKLDTTVDARTIESISESIRRYASTRMLGSARGFACSSPISGSARTRWSAQKNDCLSGADYLAMNLSSPRRGGSAGFRSDPAPPPGRRGSKCPRGSSTRPRRSCAGSGA